MLQSEFISGAANTSGHSVLWLGRNDSSTNDDDTLAYACSNLICIVRHNSEATKVTHSLTRHHGRVNALALTQRASWWTLYSAADDGQVVAWRKRECEKFDVLAEVDLKAPLMLVTAMFCPSGDSDLVFTADGQGKVYGLILQHSKNSFEELQTLVFPSAQTPNAIHVCGLSEDVTGLFVGGVDGHIHVYAGRTSSLVLKQSKLEYVGLLSGREDWVTCIDHCLTQDGILFASGSQDGKIRLWRVTASASMEQRELMVEAGDLQEMENDQEEDEAVEEGVEGQDVLVTEESTGEARLVFQLSDLKFAVHLEALLIGHEDWVTSVHWLPRIEGSSTQPIFSTSMDRNMIVWLPDPTSGIWVPATRMGDVGGTLGGSVGANLLGFVSGVVSPHENRVLGIGYGGSFHLWAEETKSKKWRAMPFLSGHFGAVNDLAWSHSGNLLFTGSSDQTCRVFARFSGGEYFELSRPQVHGYDINCLALSPSSLTLYSGGDEKLVRIFEAPGVVVQGIKLLTQGQIADTDRYG